MSVKVTNVPNNNQNIVLKKKSNDNVQPPFRHYVERKNVSNKVKIGVFFTTLAGVAAAMAVTFKSKGIKANNLKDFLKGLTKITYDPKKFEVEKLVGRLAVGSVGGGLIGGAIFDKKENMKAKYRESIIQLIGNIGTPLLCVSAGCHLFEAHFEQKVIKALNLGEKAGKIPKIVVSAGLLIAAIFAGNKIGNVINEKVFKVNDNRKLKISDMSPHIDDACLALSLVASESSQVVSRIIPAALMVAGISTGVAKERPERLQANKA
ncbi:MAG: hypothetical protein WCY19_02150 [Candidatus Gastranaerophilaceae bacterium]